MKKIVSVLFAVAIVSANVLAQEKPIEKAPRPQKSPEERAELMTKRMTKELSLNADQQTKIKAVVLKRAQERDVRIKEAKEQRERGDSDFKSILTPEQYTLFLQHKEEMKKKREQRKMQPPPPPSPDSSPAPPAPGQK